MVCERCIMAVRGVLQKLQINAANVTLGCVDVEGVLSKQQLQSIKEELKHIGFDLIEDDTEHFIAEVKQAIIDCIRSDNNTEQSLSAYLSSKFSTDFTTISRTFTAIEGRNIEKYYLQQRIEYVKELIQYGELSIKEIAWKTKFSSVAHLSRQFKQYTGITPTAFKNNETIERKGIDKV